MDAVRISYRAPRKELWLALPLGLAGTPLCYPLQGPNPATLLAQPDQLLRVLLLWCGFLASLCLLINSLRMLRDKPGLITLTEEHLSAPPHPRKAPVTIAYTDIVDYRMLGEIDEYGLAAGHIAISHRNGRLKIHQSCLPSIDSYQLILDYLERYTDTDQQLINASLQSERCSQLARSMLNYNQKMIERMELTRAARPLNELEQRYLEQLEQEQNEHRQMLAHYAGQQAC